MTPFITKDKLQQLLMQGLSESEIARHTGIPRSTLRRRIQALRSELIDAWEDLKEMQAWWRARKRALQSDHSRQETQQQIYDVEKCYIEAITRAADVEGVSITDIVNRAFRQYFCAGGIAE